METFFAIFDQLPGWLTAITAVVTAATAILAGNFGKNRNADDG